MKLIIAWATSVLAPSRRRTFAITITSLAVACALLPAFKGIAALTYNDGNVFLGFRVSGATADSYLVNLGPDSQFTLLSTGTFGGAATIGADLQSLYGMNWYDRSDLFWGIFGANDSDGISLYASRARTDPAIQATPWQPLSFNARGNTETQINNVRNGFIGTGYTTTQLTGNAGSQEGTAANSYYAAVNSNPDFGSSSAWGSIEGNAVGGIDTVVLDLFSVGKTSNPTTPTSALGRFTINDSGTVIFTAVPEPSTYGLLAFSALWLMALRRWSSRASKH